DLIFVVDPWIWLIIGGPVVWLTTRGAWRALAWFAIGMVLSFVMMTALRAPAQFQVTVPAAVLIVWFTGVATVVVGSIARWGRAGASAARWSLMVLALYYGSMWIAHRAAVRQATSSPPLKSGVSSVAAWPVPADPTKWQAAATSEGELFQGKINLRTKQTAWGAAGSPPANPGIP